MTDYNQELYWREYQHHVAMAAAAAAVAGSNKDPLQAAKTEFIKEAFVDRDPVKQKDAVEKLLKTANGEAISLADSNSAGDTPVTVKEQFEVIVTNLSAVSEDGPVTANIVLPVDAGISAETSYTVPTNTTLKLDVYTPSQTPRSSGAVTISGSDHLFKAEGGSIIINDGYYKVSAPNKYVIRAGINPSKSRKIEDALSSTVTINGGTFESDSYVMTHWGNSTTTVKGGTFKSPSAIFSGNGNAWCANAKLTITGGKFEVASDAENDGYTTVIGYWPVGNGELKVSGGTFTINTPSCPASIFAVRAGNAEITGGTYTISSCDTESRGKVGDAKTVLPAGMFTVTSNAGYVNEPTATITVDANKFTKPANVADIVVLDSVEPKDFDILLGNTDQTKYDIEKFILENGEVVKDTESSTEETTQA